MSVLARRLFGGGLVVATVLGGLIMASTIVDAESGAKYKGDFDDYYMSATSQAYGISGEATMKIRSTSTTVEVVIEGLLADELYTSHLHNGACGTADGHYQNVPALGRTSTNEIWISSFEMGSGIIVAEGETVATAEGAANWVARVDSATETNAMSVVVHAPGGARITCANLELAPDNNGINSRP